MAKRVNKKNVRKAKKSLHGSFNVYWTKKNYLILSAGLAVIIIGFFLMSIGPWQSFPSLFISPILLVIGYLIILPAAVLYRSKEKSENTEGQEIASSKS
jgi:membrane protein YdbS with pleckstrin-like domain